MEKKNVARAHSTNNNNIEKIKSSPVFSYDTKINKPNANQLSLETYAKKQQVHEEHRKKKCRI